ncbi:MAG TPA: MraY family glycosyltransferase [Patescibacteria group bacterium]|nr:MraY family glycosyltransferase [Patescibacteria group bacterium]
MILETVVLPFLLALSATAAITPLVIYIGKRIKLVDDPKVHKHPGVIHTTPIPRGGGIALFFGVVFASIFFIPLTTTTLAIFIASFIILVVGVLDDRRNSLGKDLSPYIRFIILFLCAVIVVGSGVTIDFITHPLGGVLHFDTFALSLFGLTLRASDIISILWIVWVMNMLNWSKGVDGQMPGIVAISAIVIGILSLRFPVVDHTILLDAKLSFIIAGSALGFLLFNFYPAKIFPGYSATALYLLLAVVSILSSAKLATAILVMGIPSVDAIFTILRRILSGRSPFWHDNKHLHHILLKRGLSQRQIAVLYWGFSALLGTIALTLQSKSKLFAIIMLVVIVGGALLFLHLTAKYTHEKEIA